MNFNIQFRILAFVPNRRHGDTELQFRILADGHSEEWKTVPYVAWADKDKEPKE